MNVVTTIVISMLISAFGVIAIFFLIVLIMTVVPYFRTWLQRKLDKAFEPRECASCKHCAMDYSVRPERHYCFMNGKNVLRYSSCDRWERRE